MAEKREFKKNFILECCVDSAESAMIATKAGADRLELCSNLLIGGTTPTAALFEEVRSCCGSKIHVLVRPRFGDFCYTECEFRIIREEVKSFRRLGAEGVVIGILRPDGSLNREQMKILVEEAEGMSVTLHRAFDMCADPLAALEEAAALGIDTILTSGQKNSCREGCDCLKKLVKQSAGRVDIMAGGGVVPEIIGELYSETGITSYHMSGKQVLDSAMRYRKADVHMGLAGFSEYEIFRADEEKIRKVRRKLEAYM